MTLALPKPTKPPKVRAYLRRNTKPLRRTCVPRRSGRPRQQRRGAIAAMERRATHLWGLIVKARAGGLCEYHAHLTGDMHLGVDPAHIFRRGRKSTKHHVSNGLWLCREAHDLLKSATVGKPSRMGAFVQDYRGWRFYEALELLARREARFREETLRGLELRAEAMGLTT